jgi:ABC-type dipeptide/oligopeptide/nickel transport system ATPase component
MRQRVMIAMAIATSPALLIADEPTTALDATIQAQILDLLDDIKQQTGMGIVFITHDLSVVARLCQRVVVLYAGQVVEETDVQTLFSAHVTLIPERYWLPARRWRISPKHRWQKFAARYPLCMSCPAAVPMPIAARWRSRAVGHNRRRCER